MIGHDLRHGRDGGRDHDDDTLVPTVTLAEAHLAGERAARSWISHLARDVAHPEESVELILAAFAKTLNAEAQRAWFTGFQRVTRKALLLGVACGLHV